MKKLRTKPMTNKKGKADNIYLTLNIENFGPISKGTIDMKPLTILVGPNSCGKSHAAVLVHSIVEVYTYQSFYRYDNPNSRNVWFAIHAESSRIVDEYYKHNRTIVDSNIHDILARIRLNALKQTLLQNFTPIHNDLIQIGKKRSKLYMKTPHTEDSLTCSPSGFRIGSVDHSNLQVYFSNTNKSAKNSVNTISSKDKTQHMNIDVSKHDDIFASRREIQMRILSFARRQLGVNRSIYFPAERAGLTISHKSLMLNYYNRLGNLDVDWSTPNITNVLAGFLSLLIKLDPGANYPKRPGRPNKFFGLANAVENQMFGGNIITKPDQTKSLDIFLQYQQRDFPLHTAASSTKDLAVFLLYIKHEAREGDVIILEEPEINLHPRNQLRFARFIVQLINSGLRFLVTTHSPYFLEQLSHCVIAGITQGPSVNVLAKNEQLRPENVAAYSFKNDGTGYEILPICINEDGIPQSEFMNVDDELYDEIVQLGRGD